MARLTDDEFEIAKQIPIILIEMFSLDHWSFDLSWDPIESDDPSERAYGTCDADPIYLYADIRIDLARHKALKSVVHTIRHEFIHVLHAEYEAVSPIVQQFVQDHTQRLTLNEALRQASERAVCQMERAMGHGFKGGSLKSLISEARRRLREVAEA